MVVMTPTMSPHPQVRTFDNSTPFEGKIRRVIRTVSRIIGFPLTKKKFKKFLLPEGVGLPPAIKATAEVFDVEKACCVVLPIDAFVVVVVVVVVCLWKSSFPCPVFHAMHVTYACLFCRSLSLSPSRALASFALHTQPLLNNINVVISVAFRRCIVDLPFHSGQVYLDIDHPKGDDVVYTCVCHVHPSIHQMLLRQPTVCHVASCCWILRAARACLKCFVGHLRVGAFDHYSETRCIRRRTAMGTYGLSVAYGMTTLRHGSDGAFVYHRRRWM